MTWTSPEGPVGVGCEEGGGRGLELLRTHAHGLLHLGGGGRDEVLVNVAAQALLPEHTAHQLQRRTQRLLAAGNIGPKNRKMRN